MLISDLEAGRWSLGESHTDERVDHPQGASEAWGSMFKRPSAPAAHVAINAHVPTSSRPPLAPGSSRYRDVADSEAYEEDDVHEMEEVEYVEENEEENEEDVEEAVEKEDMEEEREAVEAVEDPGYVVTEVEGEDGSGGLSPPDGDQSNTFSSSYNSDPSNESTGTSGSSFSGSGNGSCRSDESNISALDLNGSEVYEQEQEYWQYPLRPSAEVDIAKYHTSNDSNISSWADFDGNVEDSFTLIQNFYEVGKIT